MTASNLPAGMPNGVNPPHEAVVSTRGVASSAQPQATQAALAILDRGGSAVDAAIAAGAVLAVQIPTAGQLGGDVFFLVRDSDGQIGAVNGSGAAPAAANLARYQEMGEIPASGWWASSIPGMVDGWRAAHRRWGKLPWSELFDTAIQLAGDGFVVTPSVNARIGFQIDLFREFEESSRIFLQENNPPEPGTLLRQPDLANTLNTIATDGPDSFYEGDLARRIAEESEKAGGPFTVDDLAAHYTPEPDPIAISYRNATVYGQPPVSQGIILLMALGALENFDLAKTGPGTADAVHLQVEAIKQGFADRVRHLGDPDVVDIPVERLLSKEDSKRRAAEIDIARRSTVLEFPPAHPDTTSMVAADGNGQIVAYIHSLYAGSGIVVPGTGIMLNNRMLGFSLDPSSPNVLAPGKRPVHTLNTALVTRGDDIWAVCTPGANIQVQHNLQVICNLIDFDMMLQAAIDAPRWSMGDQMRIGDDELQVEDRFGSYVLGSLADRGHNVKTANAWAVGGGIQVARLNRNNGFIWAGRDPRRASNLAAAL